MIRITVELLPHGEEKNRKVLDVIEISNVGKSINSGYDYLLKQSKYFPEGIVENVVRDDNVMKFLFDLMNRVWK